MIFRQSYRRRGADCCGARPRAGWPAGAPCGRDRLTAGGDAERENDGIPDGADVRCSTRGARDMLAGADCRSGARGTVMGVGARRSTAPAPGVDRN
jgi:hypothetical protein